MFRIGLIVIALFGGLANGERSTPTTPTKTKATPQNTTVFQGTVAIVTNSHVVLATRTERRTFVVPSNALIIVNRSEASLDDLLPGHLASIASSNSNGQLVANFIHASRQY